MKTVVAVFALAMAYATVRYNVFKGVPWTEWPVYVVNKGFALASLLLLTIYIARRVLKGTDHRVILTAGWLSMLIHAWMSVAIIGPAYYPRFFDNGKLTFAAGCSMLMGVIATVALHHLARRCNADAAHMVTVMGVALFLVGLHAALLGFSGWFEPEAWPGYMAPITLISFIAGVVALLLAWRNRRPDA